jgi:hypothetical protein
MPVGLRAEGEPSGPKAQGRGLDGMPVGEPRTQFAAASKASRRECESWLVVASRRHGAGVPQPQHAPFQVLAGESRGALSAFHAYPSGAGIPDSCRIPAMAYSRVMRLGLGPGVRRRCRPDCTLPRLPGDTASILRQISACLGPYVAVR